MVKLVVTIVMVVVKLVMTVVMTVVELVVVVERQLKTIKEVVVLWRTIQVYW